MPPHLTDPGRSRNVTPIIFVRMARNWRDHSYLSAMNRREFNFGLAAAGLAPLVPGSAAAKAAPAAVTANFTPFMYASGAQFARLTGNCSPDLLAARFGLSTDAAAAINARLIKNGILAAPDALGVSRATDKYAPAPPAEAETAMKATQDAPEAGKRLNLLDEIDPDERTCEADAEADQVDTVSDAGEETA